MNEYISDLINNISNTQISSQKIGLYSTYDQGLLALLDKFIQHKEQRTKLFFLGNGGSAAIAIHMTSDFMKNGGMRTCSLYDSSTVTCMGNDCGYESIFSRQLDFLLNKDDLLVAISSSGNSLNIVNAIITAKQKGAEVITFTGFQPDNKVRQMGDLNVYVPCGKYGIVESIHNLILQQIVDEILEQDGAAE